MMPEKDDQVESITPLSDYKSAQELGKEAVERWRGKNLLKQSEPVVIRRTPDEVLGTNTHEKRFISNSAVWHRGNNWSWLMNLLRRVLGRL